ncbi:MAG: 4-alpha-glucanotransferase [Bacteroidota bacterium]
MILRFKIDYRTTWGERIYVCGSTPELGEWQIEQCPEMMLVGAETWELVLDLPYEKIPAFEYKYLIKNDEGRLTWEFGNNRALRFSGKKYEIIDLLDTWRATQGLDNLFLTKAFSDIVFRRNERTRFSMGRKKVTHLFQVHAPKLPAHHILCVLGDDEALGEWDLSKAVPMSDEGFPLWKAGVKIQKQGPISYKYAIYEKESMTFVRWEGGENRVSYAGVEKSTQRLIITTDAFIKEEGELWKGTGVAIPIFSLRSQESAGVGEFLDIKKLVDWCKAAHVNMIQVLPINDTIASHSWTDSYPYKGISVFALHPMYANMKAICSYHKIKLPSSYLEKTTELNRNEVVDYEAAVDIKSNFYAEVYPTVKANLAQDKTYQAFFKEQKEWLVPYAAFSYLRDLHKNPDFSRWGEYAQFDQEKIERLCSPGEAHYDDIGIHYFIQFHLHLQLLEAVEYAHEKNIVLKGDIPIGISRYSVDAWQAPKLYNMETQAGAPPDAFAISGQNWGFPTYNWYEMAKDDFKWWKQRLTHMAQYFDAYRIDHILGFFRIWEIPYHSLEGLMGHFNPSMAFHRDELFQRGLPFDYERYCSPYIRGHMLVGLFGEYTDWVIQEFLEEYQPGHFRIKLPYHTQRSVLEYVSQLSGFPREAKERIIYGMFSLINEVLFFEAPFSSGTAFNPRIAMQHTRSFMELDAYSQEILNRLYDDFFYKRHEGFWREEAMRKLPAIIGATDMLVCGEDLGMVPATVPSVMDELGILSLEIQRMPKDQHREFGHPADYPYMSVCSTSSHDMSTIRGWWEEDRELVQRFYETILGHNDAAPYFCEPWIAEEVLVQHLYSPSMWAVFPIQDLLAIDGQIRREMPQEEQINVPANPNHYWQYRMHMNLEELITETSFSQKLAGLIQKSGRGIQQVEKEKV